MIEKPALKSDESRADAAYAGGENLEISTKARNYSNFLRALIVRMSPSNIRIAMDYGAGIGTFSDALGRGVRVICIEPDTLQSDRLRARGFDVRELGAVPDSSIDYIFTLNVLEHIKDDWGALRVLFRKLRPGGVLFAYVPAFQLLWSSMDDRVGHVRRYRRKGLRDAVNAAGFDVSFCRYVDSAGFLATLLFKALGNSRGTINQFGLRAFDRIAFPAGRLLDVLGLSFVLGKNVYCCARKAG